MANILLSQSSICRNMWSALAQNIVSGDPRTLARAISLVENEAEGYEDFLRGLNVNHAVPITGITGPPGAGKSTLTDGIIGSLLERGLRVGVLCVDPSSPFNSGALLGDRIRMREWYNHPDVFIRSLAARGALGGLHPMVFELADVMRSAGLDHILIETVGVGQSEVEIASLADTTVVVLVPEAGDDIQAMKSGLMEVADLFVVNKCDRPGADVFVHNLRQMLRGRPQVKVVQTIASEKEGIDTLTSLLLDHKTGVDMDHRYRLLAARLYQQISKQRMKDITVPELTEAIRKAYTASFNLYRFSAAYLAEKQ